MSKQTAKLIDLKKILEELKSSTIAELAKKYQVDYVTIWKKLKKAGYTGGKKTGRPPTKFNKKQLLKDLEKYSPHKLAPIYNVGYPVLLRYIKSNVPEYQLRRGRRKKNN